MEKINIFFSKKNIKRKKEEETYVAKGMKRRKIYRKCLMCVLVICTACLTGLLYYNYLLQVPDAIYLKTNTSQEFNYHVPVSGKIIGDKSVPVSLNQKVTFASGDDQKNYKMELKLFGILPFKDVNIKVINQKELIPAGIPIGIYIKTEGVLVIDVGEFEGKDVMVAPARYVLQKGDYILAMDGNTVTDKRQIMEYITRCNGNAIMFTIKRKKEIFDVSIQPTQMKNGQYKIGAWLRDSAQGIGTLTYVDEQDHFGALGHGVSDVDTNELMELNQGLLYKTEIVAVKKGLRGVPGELTGYIDYSPENMIGIIVSNNEKGVYGIVSDSLTKKIENQPLEIGLKQEVTLGPAQMYCTINDERDKYDIEITNISYDSNNVNRQISITVKDERLLNTTGGIVQGISGSPILQNGRLIGAVTHVLVNDPTKGYGIFIEEMLDDNQAKSTE